MALSANVSAGDDVLASQYNNLRSDVFGSHHSDAAGTLLVNADIDPAAAIAYSKLNLATSITNADIAALAAIAYSKLNLTGSILNADINAAAAIAYSKLALSNSIVNADINASAAIDYTKLDLAGDIVNADINAAAAIAYSKLNLTGNIVNADINASAAIAMSKLAALTASRVLVSDGSGFISAASATATNLSNLVSGNEITEHKHAIANVIVGSGTRTTAEGSGNEDISLSFTPKAVWVTATYNTAGSAQSVGYSDGTNNGCSYQYSSGSSAVNNSSNCIYLFDSSPALKWSATASFPTDTLRLAFTANTPSVDCDYTYMAIR